MTTENTGIIWRVFRLLRTAAPMNDVQKVMAQIQRKHPKPKGSGTCDSCGAPIVWIGRHTCNPPILKGVTADVKVHSFRESLFVTCPNANNHRKKLKEKRR